MKKISRILALLLVIVLAFSLIGCKKEEPKVEEKQIVIGYSAIAYSLAPLPEFLYKNLEAECTRRGWEFLPLVAEGDAMLQGEQVGQLVQQEPDCIVLFPGDPQLAIDWAKTISDAGIYCITLHTDVAEEGRQYVQAHCGPNNYEMASGVAMTIINDYGPDAGINIVEIGGVPVQNDYIERVAGFDDTIKANSNYNVLGIEWAFSSRATAQEKMENFISAYGDQINVLMGFMDDLTLGGVNALQDAGMTDVGVYSISAYSEGLTAIKEGKLRVTTIYSTAEAAAEAARCLDLLLAGESSGDYFHYIPMPQVNASNVDQYKSEY